MAQQYFVDDKVGSCRVNGATGDSSISPFNRTGLVSATARTGAGAYAVTLGGNGIDSSECHIDAQVLGGAGNANIQVDQTSDTNINVTTFVAGVATDENFNLEIRRVRS